MRTLFTFLGRDRDIRVPSVPVCMTFFFLIACLRHLFSRVEALKRKWEHWGWCVARERQIFWIELQKSRTVISRYIPGITGINVLDFFREMQLFPSQWEPCARDIHGTYDD